MTTNFRYNPKPNYCIAPVLERTGDGIHISFVALYHDSDLIHYGKGHYGEGGGFHLTDDVWRANLHPSKLRDFSGQDIFDLCRDYPRMGKKFDEGEVKELVQLAKQHDKT